MNEKTLIIFLLSVHADVETASARSAVATTPRVVAVHLVAMATDAAALTTSDAERSAVVTMVDDRRVVGERADGARRTTIG